MDIAESHGLRGYDAVHVATALEIRDQQTTQGQVQLTFVSADREQLTAAAAEGLQVEDPSRHR
jgi:hypothetical protein